MVQQNKPMMTLVIDPRFSGGTSSAVAREIHTLAPICDLSVVAISSKLFKGQNVHPLIQQACDETHTPLCWDPDVVSSELIALHNPSFLKFDDRLTTRLVCDRLFVVCHENFVRPDGPEGFDVAHCLSLIAQQTLARKKYLAPISGWNRKCVQDWMSNNVCHWSIAPLDWTNICDFEYLPPINNPRDRRGRHSRPGAEKFPPLQDLVISFPQHSETIRILGADSLMAGEHPTHWQLLPFGAEDVDAFLRTIDFFIYYTHPFWQESFGRVIAEAMAAGKVVITNDATGATFGDGVISAQPNEIDSVISGMIGDPILYQTQVKKGQQSLTKFGVTAFQDRFRHLVDETKPFKNVPTELEKLYAFL